MATYQLTENGNTLHILMRAFSSYSCLTACDQFQSLQSVLQVFFEGQLSYSLNYFRCYTFEGANGDDVTNAGTTPNVVCKSTLLLSFCSYT